MTYLSINGIAIEAVSACVPRTKESLELQIKHHGLERVTRAKQLLGITSRRLALGRLRTRQLMEPCFTTFLDHNLISTQDIAIVCCVSQTDTGNPGISFQLHKAFKLPQNCLCLDLKYGCAGLTNAALLCGQLLTAFPGKKAVILAGDTLTELVPETDPATSLLFGDAAGGLLLGNTENGRGFHGCIKSNGQGLEQLTIDCLEQTDKPSLHMKGKEIFSFSIVEVPLIIRDTLQFAQQELSDIDFFFLHQANAFMLETIRKKMHLPPQKMPIELGLYGNTSGASIALALCSYFATTEVARINGKMLLCGFGIGLSWSCLITDFEKVTILPVREL